MECATCGQQFEAVRRNARYCSGSCRVKAHRSGATRQPTPAAAADSQSEPLTDATRAALERAGRLDHPAGVAALALAALVDNPPPMSASSIAGWVREHRASMTEALKDADTQAVSLVDQLRARRDAKRGA